MASFCRNPRLLARKGIASAAFCTHNAPPFPSFRAAKAAIVSESDPEKLAQLFEQSAHFPNFCRHRPIFHLSVRRLARAGRSDLVNRVIQTQIDTPTFAKSEGFWIRLMMLYSSAGMVEQSLQTLHYISEKRYFDFTEKSLCAILTVYLNNGMFERVHELFDNMPKKLGVTPGVVSYNLVLKTLVKENRIESAREWIEKMENDVNIKPCIQSYNILLGAYIKEGARSGFDGLVKELLKKGLECNSTTYNLRISRFCKDKECVRARKMLEEMISKDVKPNSASYNSVIDGFCRAGDFESAKKVLERMLADGYVLPSSFTYYTLMRSMVKEGEFDSALDVCKEIIKRKWIPPFEAMEGLVNGLVKMSRSAEAKEIIEKMKKRLRGTAVESWEKIEAAVPL
ncbi:pentatricopeptide repeat-containing protein [Tripterygium wilfordii]|uniref:Pentatricopeptide repeat-containing protein n=1 Tax=Tripterygium wilfordii TaxID=458696 RepID=A0A7J7DM27_TRIWF|nr:pentatricopeptide repeat-containing protein At1g61870, mitochondrial-like [Tripterygium wilfordii]KAF5747415.1 pentatricopeptide repeat-containing protein [Tripterygium wilfordii]